MNSSLRSRLWLSYALVSLAALIITALTLIIYLVRNPLIFRQTVERLQMVEALILNNQDSLNLLPQEALQKSIEAYDRSFNTRILIFTRERVVLVDSRHGSPSQLTMPRRLQMILKSSSIHDAKGGLWLYSLTRLDNGNFLMAASPRPKIALVTILREDFMPSFLASGVIALLVSLLAAYGLARWIGDPLQRLVTASRKIPTSKTDPLSARGPHEVQELIRAFNEMNTRVETSQSSQREFVANVSHELKTPLTSIQGFAQAILDGTADTRDAQLQAAQVIYDESDRMHRMVLDLLDLARLDAGTLELKREPLDLGHLLRGIAAKFAPQAQASGVTIVLKVNSAYVVSGDGDRLSQAFTNLVDNSIKFSPRGGQVSIQAAGLGGTVQVEVTDNGIGISPADLPHIFDRFYQVDPSRSGGLKHGAGLGLAIVKEIVGSHGGKISVRSEPGVGSTFTVTLPLKDPTAGNHTPILSG